MNNFTVYNPVKLQFGKGVIENLGEQVKQFGKNVLLIYGKNSIKKNGIYNQIIGILNQHGATITEFSGIKPNPVVTDAVRAVETGTKAKVQWVLAVGGGSVIDTSKLVSLCIPGKLDVWQVMTHKQKPAAALPLVSVLTLAATGTEMNQFAVLQNEETKEKIGYGSPLSYPAVSYCDPSYTVSVNKYYTAYGIADIIAHALEGYFGEGDARLSDRFVVSIIRELAEAGTAIRKKPNDYELRARIMWASTCALNGMTFYGRKTGDFGVHDCGHILSLLYDMPHGATLSIVYPAWMKYHATLEKKRIEWLGKEIFGVKTVKQTIAAFEELYTAIGSPVRLPQMGITPDMKKEIVAMMNKNKVTGVYHKLDKKAVSELVELMY